MSGPFRRAAIAAVALAALGMWFWWSRPSPAEREVRRLFADMTNKFNDSTTDGLGTVARAARLGAFFTDDVVVELGEGSPPIHGRDTLMGMAVRLQPRTAAFVLELKDISVNLTDETHGYVTLTALIRRRTLGSGEESLDAREFSADVRSTDGRWRVSRLVAVDTLR
jgi:hypothetical protein